jgi:hypothetical protein
MAPTPRCASAAKSALQPDEPKLIALVFYLHAFDFEKL